MKKRIPTGVSSFEKVIETNCYYVDKTMLVKELLDATLSGVTLITRPRRFGKSLNLSMLECFLDIARKEEGMKLFDGLAISKEKEFCEEFMHGYPVIHVTFKDAGDDSENDNGKKADDIASALNSLKFVIGRLASSYDFLENSPMLNKRDKLSYRRLATVNEDAGDSEYKMSLDTLGHSLETLSALLHKHYGVPAVILIDEYDVPLNNAFEGGYYKKFIKTYRTLLSSALKDNDYLAFAVVTGCLRISKESIFTGVNNFRTLDVTRPRLKEYFGFDDKEVSDMLDYYGLAKYHGKVKFFYDGYRFGSLLVYNPWSIIQFVSDAIDNIEDGKAVGFKCGWLSTSGNDIMNRLLEKALRDEAAIPAIEDLSNGLEIQVQLIDQLTFDDMYSTWQGLWTVMLHAGYLTCTEELGEGRAKLKVPNEEVMRAFDKLVLDYVRQAKPHGEYMRRFCEAVETFDPAAIEEKLNDILDDEMSVRDNATRDYKENFYQGVVGTALLYRSDWSRKSNQESGDGYPDMMVEDDDKNWGIIFELKYSDNGEDFKAALDEGENQIFTRRYPRMLHRRRRDPIHLYSIAFHGKHCKVREVFEKDHQ